MKPDEAAFESHIAEWLVGHGDYTAWKLGTQSTDFNVARGLDPVEAGCRERLEAMDRDDSPGGEAWPDSSHAIHNGKRGCGRASPAKHS